MFGITVRTNAQGLVDALERLDGVERQRAMAKAVGSGGSVIVKEARKELAKATSRSKSKHSNIVKGWGLKVKNGIVIGAKRLDEGIKMKTHKNNMPPFAKVNILSDHRLKWFEHGTRDPRTIKNYLGHKGRKKDVPGMKGTQFFTKAIQNAKEKAYQRMQQVIQREIAKIYYR